MRVYSRFSIMKKGIELHFISGVYYEGFKGRRVGGGYEGWRVADCYRRMAASKHPSSLASRHKRVGGLEGDTRVGGRLTAIGGWQHPSFQASWRPSINGGWLFLSGVICTSCDISPSDVISAACHLLQPIAFSPTRTLEPLDPWTLFI